MKHLKVGDAMSGMLLKLSGLSTVVVLATVLISPTPVRADTIFDVEHARATARAGRPLSDHDIEYLDRWGALSESPGWRRGYYDEPGYDSYYQDERPAYRRKNSRWRR
jgi:hypothetical protein